MKPVVSICCTAYNHEKYIAQAIEGFLMQKTTFPIEIIIHDDASTDKTVEIIERYAKEDARFVTIFQTENKYSKGIKPWVNFVFPKAQGKYIALCEGDDYWVDPYKLQKQVDFLEQNEEYVVCSHNAKIINDKNENIQDFKIPELFEDKIYSKMELKKGAYLLTLTMCFRNVIKEFPNEMRNVINGDTFLISLLGQHGKGKYIHVITPAMYRVHDTGVWSMINALKKNEHRILFYYNLKKYYAKRNDAEVVFDANYKVNYNYKELLISCLQKRDLQKFIGVVYNWGLKNKLFSDKENYTFTKKCLSNYLKNKPLVN